MKCFCAFVILCLCIIILFSVIFQILKCIMIVFKDHFKFFTFFHFTAVCTCLNFLFQSALSNRANWITKNGFWSFDSAAGTVYHLRGDFYIIKLTPKFWNFTAQLIVVIYCCNTGFTCFTIYSTLCYNIFHSAPHLIL